MPLLLFDQLEERLEGQFWYQLSRNRSTCRVRPYIRAICNLGPEDDRIGGWLHRLIAWRIDADTGHPIAERSGVIRWFVRIQDAPHRADSPNELLTRFAPPP